MHIRSLVSPRESALFSILVLAAVPALAGCDSESLSRLEDAGAVPGGDDAGPPGVADDAAVAPPDDPGVDAGPGEPGPGSPDPGTPSPDPGAPPPAEVWRPFSDDSPWNTPIPEDAAVRPDSDALMADMANSAEPREMLVSITPWSIPVYEVDSSTPLVDVYARISNEGLDVTFRWPVPPEAMPAPASDAHLTLVDRAAGRAYDFWQGSPRPDGAWDCSVCATVDLEGTGVRRPKNEPGPWYVSHGSRACGFPLIAGLVTVEEIEAGRIDHALVFAYPALRQRWFTSPASTGHPPNGIISEDSGIPCGGRIQLDPRIDVDALDLSPAARTIARALQEYGAYVGDFSGTINVYAEGQPEAQEAWEGVLNTNSLTPLDLERDFRVLEWGELTPDG
jgi:hypothetical protein